MVALGAFVGGCIALFIGCCVSSAGGVGGGGINVPILLIIFGYSFTDSVVFSLCIVLGNAFAQSVINIRKIHPNSFRAPLIFWELVIVLLPAQMGGSNIGSLLAKIFPDSILYILAFVVLSYASTVSLFKGLHKWHDESALKATINQQSVVSKLQSDLEVGADAHNPIISTLAAATKKSSKSDHGLQSDDEQLDVINLSYNSNLSTDNDKKVSNQSCDAQSHSSSFLRESLTRLQGLSIADITPTRIMEVGGVVNPVRVQIAIGLIWVVYTGLVVGLTLVPSCSPSYVTLFIVMYIPLLMAIAWGVYYNVSVAPCIVPKGSDSPLPPANDLDFSRIANTLPPAAFVIGIICSLLGIGGGELFGPLMLSYGILPQVSSATTSMLSLLNTGSNVVRSGVSGDIDIRLGVVFFIIGLLGGAVGRQFGLYVSTRYGRPSVIILSLVVALYITCLYYIYDLASSNFDASLQSFC